MFETDNVIVREVSSGCSSCILFIPEDYTGFGRCPITHEQGLPKFIKHIDEPYSYDVFTLPDCPIWAGKMIIIRKKEN